LQERGKIVFERFWGNEMVFLFLKMKKVKSGKKENFVKKIFLKKKIKE